MSTNSEFSIDKPINIAETLKSSLAAIREEIAEHRLQIDNLLYGRYSKEGFKEKLNRLEALEGIASMLADADPLILITAIKGKDSIYLPEYLEAFAEKRMPLPGAVIDDAD